MAHILGPLTPSSSSLSPPHTEHLSVMWGFWTQPVGLSPGKFPAAVGALELGPDSGLGIPVLRGHCLKPWAGTQGMDVSGVVPKPRGPRSARAPGLPALATIKDDEGKAA